jgi:tRNA(Ile)-lysidine synthase
MDETVLVAVSGGLDSVVLLHILYRLSAKFHWRLTVAHFNHRLRGTESDADERFVRTTAQRLKLKCVVENADVGALARREGMSVEMAARQVRHEFLARTARQLKISKVALAHHADDQVELFFLRLFRGAGGEGLAGMKWISLSTCHSSVRLVRPLLDQSKAALRSYAEEQGTSFREDSSNEQFDYLRNRIRNKLLPHLAQRYQPALAKTVSRSMDVIGAEADFVSEAAERWLQAKRRLPFQRLHLAVQRRVVQLQLLGTGVAPDFDLVERLRQAPGELVTVGPNLLLSREPDGRLVRKSIRRADFCGAQKTIELKGESGAIVFGGLTIKWRRVVSGNMPNGLPRFVAGKELFDADRLGPRITLRHWREGDRFQPIGMRGSVKLQDLFTNQKIDRSERRRRVVAATEAGELFWVEGLRISERFKLNRETKCRVEWRWRR